MTMATRVDGSKVTDKNEEYSETRHNSCFERRGLILLVFIFTLICTSLLIALILTLQKRSDDCQRSSNGSAFQNTFPQDSNIEDAKEQSNSNSSWPHLRIPRSVLPTKYNLKLSLDPNNSTFTGSLRIKVKVQETTNKVVIHVADLNVSEEHIQIVGPHGDMIAVSDVSADVIYETYILHTRQELVQGEVYDLIFGDFEGSIRSDTRALYRSSYKTANGTVRYLIASQLEAIDARRVFPCFDEPDMKAVFVVSVVHSTDYVALSNTDVERSEIMMDGRVEDTFEETPLMSTYLLAFVVSDFIYKSVTMETGLRIRVWSRPDMINMTSHALQLIPDLYTFFEQYFDCPEFVKKADHVAVPDFASLGMENWGLIIYRENVLLHDQNSTSDYETWINSLVIAHEIAHSWFGNMVTMHWWEDLWLNEGFASILMSLPFQYNDNNNSDALNAQLIKSKFLVMTSDSFPTSHPVTMPIKNLYDINNGFDKISYDKGLSLLRMLMGFLGRDNFRKGLKSYVHKYKFSNANASQLWSEMEGFTKLPFRVGGIMDTWMQQKGFPVVQVKYHSTKGYQLEQQRFMANPRDVFDASESIYKYKWIVPFSYVSEDDLTERIVWLDTKPVEIQAKNDTWLLGNVDSMGYYLVNYEEAMWGRIINQLEFNYSVFSMASRANLINDVFSLARAERIPYAVAFNLGSYLKREENLVPVMALVQQMNFLRSLLSSSTKYGLLKKFLRSLIKPAIMKIINTPPQEKLQKALMELLYLEGVRYDIEAVVKIAMKHFHSWKNDQIAIHPSYSLASYVSGVKYGDEDDWNAIWRFSQETTVASTTEMLLCALGYSRETWILKRYLSYAMNYSLIKPQHLQSIFYCICENQLGRQIAFDFVVTRWKEIITRFESEIFIMKDIGSIVFSQIDNEYQHEQLLTLFKRTPPPESFYKEVENILHQIKSNLEWKHSNMQNIEDWLTKYVE